MKKTFVVVLFSFESRQSFIMLPSVTKNILDRPHWPQSLRDSPAFTSEVLVLKVNATMPSTKLFEKKYSIAFILSLNSTTRYTKKFNSFYKRKNFTLWSSKDMPRSCCKILQQHLLLTVRLSPSHVDNWCNKISTLKTGLLCDRGGSKQKIKSLCNYA